MKEINALLLKQLHDLKSNQERDQKLVSSLKLTMENKQLKKQLEDIQMTLLETSAGQQKKGFLGKILK